MAGRWALHWAGRSLQRPPCHVMKSRGWEGLSLHVVRLLRLPHRPIMRRGRNRAATSQTDELLQVFVGTCLSRGGDAMHPLTGCRRLLLLLFLFFDFPTRDILLFGLFGGAVHDAMIPSSPPRTCTPTFPGTVHCEVVIKTTTNAST